MILEQELEGAVFHSTIANPEVGNGWEGAVVMDTSARIYLVVRNYSGEKTAPITVTVPGYGAPVFNSDASISGATADTVLTLDQGKTRVIEINAFLDSPEGSSINAIQSGDQPGYFYVRNNGSKNVSVDITIVNNLGISMGTRTLYTGKSYIISPLIKLVEAEYPDGADNTAPLTEVEISGGSGADGWFNSDVTVSLSAQDDLSGVSETVYRMGEDETWKVYTEPVILSKDGIYSFRYRSTDNAGNTEEEKEAAIRLDKTAPVIEQSFSDEYMYMDNLTLDFSAYDVLSGVAESGISVNGQVYQAGDELLSA